MDTGYFRSKEFTVAIIAAGVLVLAGVVVANNVPSGDDWAGPWRWGHDDCQGRLGPGTAVEPLVTEGDPGAIGPRVFRTVTYSLDTTASTGGLLALCTLVGDVDVQPVSGTNLSIRFDFSTPEGDATNREVLLDVFFRDQGGALQIANRMDEVTERWYQFGQEAVSVDVTVLVPAALVFDIDVHTDVGDLMVGELTARSLHVHGDVGDITLQGTRSEGTLETILDVGSVTATAVEAGGDVAMRTDVGDLTVQYAALAGGVHDYRVDVGDVGLTVVQDNATGYDVHIQTDVGDADAGLGEGASRERSSDGAGHTLDVRTAGYATKAVKVEIEVHIDVGSGSVHY